MYANETYINVRKK